MTEHTIDDDRKRQRTAALQDASRYSRLRVRAKRLGVRLSSAQLAEGWCSRSWAGRFWWLRFWSGGGFGLRFGFGFFFGALGVDFGSDSRMELLKIFVWFGQSVLIEQKAAKTICVAQLEFLVHFDGVEWTDLDANLAAHAN